METLGKISYGLIVMAVGSLVNAFVIQKLWTWILMPVLGLTPITMGTAFGLSVVVAFFRAKKTDNKEEDAIEKITKALVWGFINAGFYLLIGWIASMFV